MPPEALSYMLNVLALWSDLNLKMDDQLPGIGLKSIGGPGLLLCTPPTPCTLLRGDD